MSSLNIFKNNLKNIKNFHNIKNLLYRTQFNLNEIYKFKVDNMEPKLNYYNLKKDYDKYLFYKNNYLDCYFIFWNKYSCSKIHDHSDNGCYYKVIYGNSLCEYIYDKDINITQMNTLQENEINYIDNKKGYHKMVNDDQFVLAIHIYSPPNYNMNIYD